MMGTNSSGRDVDMGLLDELQGGAGWRSLVCARCGGMVADARCSTCQDARQQFVAAGLRSAARWCAAGLAALAGLVAAGEVGLLPH